MRKADCNRIHQADIAGALLCGQCDGVGSICKDASGNDELRRALLLSGKRHGTERCSVQHDGNDVLLALCNPLQGDCKLPVSGSDVRYVKGLGFCGWRNQWTEEIVCVLTQERSEICGAGL